MRCVWLYAFNSAFILSILKSFFFLFPSLKSFMQCSLPSPPLPAWAWRLGHIFLSHVLHACTQDPMRPKQKRELRSLCWGILSLKIIPFNLHFLLKRVLEAFEIWKSRLSFCRFFGFVSSQHDAQINKPSRQAMNGFEVSFINHKVTSTLVIFEVKHTLYK